MGIGDGLNGGERTKIYQVFCRILSLPSCECGPRVWAAHQNVLFSSSIIKVIGGTAVAAKAKLCIFQPHLGVSCGCGAEFSPVQCERSGIGHTMGSASLLVPLLPAFPLAGITNTRAASEGRCYARQVKVGLSP